MITYGGTDTTDPVGNLDSDKIILPSFALTTNSKRAERERGERT